jgi:hypothetical protein
MALVLSEQRSGINLPGFQTARHRQRSPHKIPPDHSPTFLNISSNGPYRVYD